MSEIEEQAEKLMIRRVQDIRETYGRNNTQTYDKEMKEYVERMERVFEALSDEDREWLDAQLMDKFIISEQEARELYLGGVRDAMHLMLSVGI